MLLNAKHGFYKGCDQYICLSCYSGPSKFIGCRTLLAIVRCCCRLTVLNGRLIFQLGQLNSISTTWSRVLSAIFWLLIDFDITKCLFWQIIFFIILADHSLCHFEGGPGLILVPGPGLALNGSVCFVDFSDSFNT